MVMVIGDYCIDRMGMYRHSSISPTNSMEKGSGKAKTEKRLKKIEDEKKREVASSLNASAPENAV